MTTEDANLLLEKQSYDVESGRSVDRMHIHSGEIINDNDPPKAYMEVRVRGVSTTGDGDILASVDVKSTVWDLKKYIEYNVGVSCQQQRLIFQGKILEDSQTLEAYSIKDGHTLLFSKRIAQPNCALGVVSGGRASQSIADGNLNQTNLWQTPAQPSFNITNDNGESVEIWTDMHEFEAFMRELHHRYNNNDEVNFNDVGERNERSANTTGIDPLYGNRLHSTMRGPPWQLLESGRPSYVAIDSRSSNFPLSDDTVTNASASDLLQSISRRYDLNTANLHPEASVSTALRIDGITNLGHDHSDIIANDGDCFELLIGFVLGFAIGILAALCLMERSGLASVRFKAGVFMGMTWYACFVLTKVSSNGTQSNSRVNH